MAVRRSARLAAGAAAVVVLACLSWVIPTGLYEVKPGPVVSLSEVISVEGYERPRTSFYMVSVVASEASLAEVVRAAFEQSVEVWGEGAVTGGMDPDGYKEHAQALMEESKRVALQLALRESGFPVDGSGDALPPVHIGSGEVIGPSAGLAFVLEMIATLQGVDLAGGRKVAATGALSPRGEVLPVGGILQKAAACSREGIDLFLVPASMEGAARRAAGGMKVVGVRDLGDALTRLRSVDIP
ncbi:MAG: S16 family serine protease [Bacillota bacterium]